jgi:glycosyltransferase involved in cell wall biosynthesis
VICALNEANTIGEVVSKVRAHTRLVVVVDDGSTDATANLARQAGATVISHSKNKGKGAAIKTGLTFAITQGAKVVVLLDGDLQHDPSDIPKLVLPILEGRVDAVIGVRRGLFTSMPMYRRLGSILLDYGTALAGGGKLLVTDSQSGYRALSERAISKLTISCNGIGVESEMVIELSRNNIAIEEVPIEMRYDIDGSTYNPIRHWVMVAFTIFKARFQERSGAPERQKSQGNNECSRSSRDFGIK